MVPDRILIRNERVKLFAGFLNAIAVGMVGFSILRPAIETAVVPRGAGLYWGGAGLAIHAIAHYILGRLRKEPPA